MAATPSVNVVDAQERLCVNTVNQERGVCVVVPSVTKCAHTFFGPAIGLL